MKMRATFSAAAMVMLLVYPSFPCASGELTGGISNVGGVHLQEEEFAARARIRGKLQPKPCDVSTPSTLQNSQFRGRTQWMHT